MSYIFLGINLFAMAFSSLVLVMVLHRGKKNDELRDENIELRRQNDDLRAEFWNQLEKGPGE